MRILFVSILNMSFAGSIVIGVVLLLRLVLWKLPRKYICLLWLLAGLRLVMPFTVTSSFSLQPQEPLSENQWKQIESYGHVLQSDEPVEMPVPLTPEESAALKQKQPAFDPTITVSTSSLPNFPTLLPYLWLVGIGGMGLYTALSYLRLRRRVGDAVILAEGIWVSGRVASAFVLGLFRPQIYLNAGMTEADREMVLLHEQCHIRRGDHIWKLLMFAVLAVHWFNPLVWVAYGLLCRDMEMACDEAVIRKMDAVQRKSYSDALLACSAKGGGSAACPIAFGELSVKRRIKNVLRYRRTGFWMAFIAVTAAVLVAVCFLTSASADSPAVLWEIEEVKDVSVCSAIGIYCPGTYAEVQEVAQMLKTVRIDPEQQREAPMEAVWIELDAKGLVDTVCFAEDYSLVWGSLGEKNTMAYAVENPQIIEELMALVYDGVKWLHPSAAPFAAVDEPVKWVQGISVDAVEKAGVGSNSSTENYGRSHDGVMPTKRFEEFVSILNDLNENAFSEPEFYEDAWNHEILISRYPETCAVQIVDGANQLNAVVLIAPDGKLELFLTDNVQWLDKYNPTMANVWCWEIEDHALLGFMRELRARPSYIIYSTWYQEKRDTAYTAE